MVFLEVVDSCSSNRRIEGLMHVKSVEAQNFEAGGSLESGAQAHHLTQVQNCEALRQYPSCCVFRSKTLMGHSTIQFTKISQKSNLIVF
ncbi:hypothetical protein TNCV_3934831 [Trichonephila clavipes]|nr:hypothetical protein TNCV_3934831 [Trichonephila clavipes]